MGLSNPLFVKPAKSPKAASNRHTRITRGKGPTAANPVSSIVARKKWGGMKGNDGSATP